MDKLFVLIINNKRQRKILLNFKTLSTSVFPQFDNLDNKHNRENTRTNEDFLISLEQTEHL